MEIDILFKDRKVFKKQNHAKKVTILDLKPAMHLPSFPSSELQRTFNSNLGKRLLGSLE